jgi:glycosyl transferase family 25
MSAEARLRLYVISLDRSPERLKKFLADNLMVPGLDIVRFRAIDGQKLDRADLLSRKVITSDLIYSNNAVACALSHMEVWRKIVADGKPAVVCEDDALLRKDFALLHKHFAATIDQSDAVFWSYSFDLHMAYEVPGLGEFMTVTDAKFLNTEDRIAQFQNATTPTMLFRPKRLWGLACYTVTPRGAEKLLELVLPLQNARVSVICRTGLRMQLRSGTYPNLGIDVDVGSIHIDKLAAKVAVPPIAVHRKLGTASTIDGGRDDERWQAPFHDSKGNLHIPLPLSSRRVGALNDTGLKLHELKLFDKAIEYFDRALTLNPKLAEPYYNRGNALAALRRFDDALASYDAALTLRPDYASAHDSRGVVLEQLARFEGSKRKIPAKGE